MFHVTRKTIYIKDLGHHFNYATHPCIDDVKIHILDFICAPAQVGLAQDMRLHLELIWVQIICTMIPMGLNTMDKYTPQYCRNIENCVLRNKI